MNSKIAVKFVRAHSLDTYHENFLAVYNAEIEKKFPNKTFPDFTAFCQERYKKKAFSGMTDQLQLARKIEKKAQWIMLERKKSSVFKRKGFVIGNDDSENPASKPDEENSEIDGI